LEDSGSVFRSVLDCVQPNHLKAHQVGEPIVFGVDWGRHHDFTVIVVMGKHSRQMMAMERFTRLPWAQQRERLHALAKRWKPQLILAEANSIGQPNIEALQQVGLPMQGFITSAHSKQHIIDQLALALENQSIGLLEERVLLDELLAYTVERLPSGDYRFGAPSGGHDDCVMALALALHAASMMQAAFIQPRNF